MNQGCEIRYFDNNKGIGLVSTRCFKENEVIFEEKPLVSAQFAWNEAYNYSACHHCLRPLESTEENVRRLTGNKISIVPYPELCPTDKSKHTVCDDCGVKFCCDDCKQASICQYHNLLCEKRNPDLGLLVDAWKSLHHPPESATIVLLARIIATIENSKDKESTLSTLLEFNHSVKGNSSSKEYYLTKLLGQKGTECLQSMQILFPQVVSFSGFTQGLTTEEGLRTLFALVGRNGQGIGTSVFSEWVKRTEDHPMSKDDKANVDSFIDSVYEAMDNHVGEFLNNEGSGLYVKHRCINHSCDPNALVTFPHSDHTLAVVAKKEILPGEEICISYLDDCMIERSRHTRSKVLREYYLFECSCPKCFEQADQPDETSEDDDDDCDEEDDCME